MNADSEVHTPLLQAMYGESISVKRDKSSSYVVSDSTGSDAFKHFTILDVYIGWNTVKPDTFRSSKLRCTLLFTGSKTVTRVFKVVYEARWGHGAIEGEDDEEDDEEVPGEKEEEVGEEENS